MKLFCFNPYNEQDANSPELPKAGSFAVVKVKVNLLKYRVIKSIGEILRGSWTLYKKQLLYRKTG